jgi:hypothetical protein
MRLLHRRSSPRRAYIDTRTLYLACLPQWAAMYVSGEWSLEQFESHADSVRAALFAPLVGS